MIWFTSISIMFLLFIIPGLMAGLIDMIPAGDQPGYSVDSRASIYRDRYFTQYFISKDKNLTAVATSIKNPNLKNKKNIIFNLYDDKNVLTRTTTLNGMNIEDGSFIKIIFEKIPDSKNKKYHFTLSSPDAGEEETIEVFLTGPTNEILNYIYDEVNKPGGTPMVTFHKPDSSPETIKLVYINWFSKLLPRHFQKI
ncbi:MAG: hypothetical protein QMD92_00375 [bacterium]|nr:hypothetical protein [bacterium]